MPEGSPANFDANDYAAQHGADALEVLLSSASEPAGRYKLRTAAELAALPPIRWLVRGVLPAEGLAALFGASGSGKTFLALDMTAAIAGGRRWFGYRVNAAPVVYVGLEGEAGLSQRVQAWDKHHGRTPPEALRFVVSQPFDLLQSEDVAELAAACRGAGLVVVDTLNRAAPGVDENSSQDMGRIIEAAADLQRRIGGLVLLVHHAGKDQTKGMRGHSSLHAALDAAIEVRRDGDAREWRIAKSKDGADAESIPFRLEVVTLGIEADGTPLTSCAVVPDNSASEVRRVKLPSGGNQRIVWEALPDVLKHASREGIPECVPAGKDAAPVETVIDGLRGRLTCEESRQKERAQTAITGLVARGLLTVREGWLWKA